MLRVEPLVHHAVQQRFTQQLDQPLAPVAHLLAEREILLLKILAIASYGLHQVADACAIGRDRLDDRRSPIVAPDSERLHGSNLAFYAIGSFAIAFVNDEDVGNLHDAGLDRLHIVSHSGNEDYDGDICEANYVDLVLANADCLYEN